MDIRRILELQKIFGKTKSGRKIGDKAMAWVEKTLHNPESEMEKITECLNCQIILDSVYFSDGCLNCGSKDTKLVKSLNDKRISKK